MTTTDKSETVIELEALLEKNKTSPWTEEEKARVNELYKKREEEWVASGKVSTGFGDTIKKVTDTLGIKQCGGCKKRQALLNQMFPYK